MTEKKATILIVDDSAGDRELYRRALQPFDNYEFISAETGDEGLQAVHAHHPDCIILDYRLPDFNGVEFLDQLAAALPKMEMPAVIMLTGQGDETTAVNALKRGAQDYMLKWVVNRQSLSRAVENAIQRVTMQRKIDLAHEQLIQTNNDLMEANEIKDEFLAMMSHELRTPLNSIIGFTEVMMRDANDPPAEKRAKRLDKVYRNAKNLLALINDILDISKIEANQFNPQYDPTDIGALLHDCAESIRPQINRKAMKLRLRIDESLIAEPRWMTDAGRLRQVVLNLLSNAAKFTRNGHIELGAKIEGENLLIHVKDTGPGIAASHLPHLFEDFYQVDSSTTRCAGGTGLGLAICRRICQSMGGDITVASEPNVGSCFTFSVQVHPVAETTAVETDDVMLAASEAPGGFS